MSLQHVTDEEDHKTGEYLILLSPKPYSWSVHSKHLKRILSRHNQGDGKQFEVGDKICKVFVDRFGRVILSLDFDVRVQLVYGPGVLLEHLTVPSGDTELELEYRPGVHFGFVVSLCVYVRLQKAIGPSTVLLSHAAAPAHINILNRDRSKQQQGR